MRLNQHTALASSRILLVPYEPHHVPPYHAWMESEEIREATASERLTLEEEFEMQRKWRDDVDKLTFILTHPPRRNLFRRDDNGPAPEIIATQDDAPERLIGDVNLFLSDEDEGYNEDDDELGGPRRIVGEVELMIARTEHQGKGFGRAALLLFLHYVMTHRDQIVLAHCGTSYAELVFLRVKISQNNQRSLNLFEQIGFVKRSQKPNYFGEFDLIYDDLEGGPMEIEEMMREYGIYNAQELEYVYPSVNPRN